MSISLETEDNAHCSWCDWQMSQTTQNKQPSQLQIISYCEMNKTLEGSNVPRCVSLYSIQK